MGGLAPHSLPWLRYCPKKYWKLGISPWVIGVGGPRVHPGRPIGSKDKGSSCTLIIFPTMVLCLTVKFVEHTQDIAHAGTYAVSGLSREIANKQKIYCLKLLFSTTDSTKFLHKSCLGHLNLQAQNADFPVWLLRHKYIDLLDLLFPIVLRIDPPKSTAASYCPGFNPDWKVCQVRGGFFHQSS